MTLSVDQTIVITKKEKLDGSHGNDVGGHEFINDRNLGGRSIAFGKILQFGRWKILLLEFLYRESNSGHGDELESAKC